MAIKYRTFFGNRIEEVETCGETEQFVYVMRGSRKAREAKRSDYSSYFDTWQEAKQHIVDRAKSKLESARLALSRAQGEYGNAIGMKEPTND